MSAVNVGGDGTGNHVLCVALVVCSPAVNSLDGVIAVTAPNTVGNIACGHIQSDGIGDMTGNAFTVSIRLAASGNRAGNTAVEVVKQRHTAQVVGDLVNGTALTTAVDAQFFFGKILVFCIALEHVGDGRRGYGTVGTVKVSQEVGVFFRGTGNEVVDLTGVLDAVELAAQKE